METKEVVVPEPSETSGVLAQPDPSTEETTGAPPLDAPAIPGSPEEEREDADLPAPDPSPEPLVHSWQENTEIPGQESADVFELLPVDQPPTDVEADTSQQLAILEAIVYITDEPLSAKQIADGLGQPLESIQKLLDQLVEEYNRPHHGLTVKEVAGGYKMATKPEHHEAVRSFVKGLNPPLKLSLAALETLAVIAYKQPITAPEVMEVRGVQGAGVLKTLVDRKLITAAGRKNVVGKPILYRTTKDFLVQFGLKDLNELPTLKEFEELRRFAFSDADEGAPEAPPESEPKTEQQPEIATE